MKPSRLRLSAGVAGWVLALLGAGCYSPAGPEPASAAGREAAEQARREERQKIMEQYWSEHTAVPVEPLGSPGESPPLLAYPAGTYGGLRFGPRRAPNPSLAEPDR